jgi:DNA (cytosine-5)-methyltransferase 1
VVVVENVPGLFSLDCGRDFARVLAALDDCGYVGAWRVCDSQYWGVAQRRRRLFLVASLGTSGLDPEQVLSESAGREGHSQAGQEAGADVAACLRGRAARAGVNEPGRGGEDDVNLIAFNWQTGQEQEQCSSEVAPSLQVGQTVAVCGVHANQRGELRTSPLAGSLNGSRSAKQFEGVLDAGERARALVGSMFKRHDDDTDTLVPVADCLTANYGKQIDSSDGHGGPPNLLIAATLNSGGHDGGFRTEPGEHLVAGTLSTAHARNRGLGNAAESSMVTTTRRGVRRLTPLEWEKLQGFPPGWTCLCGEGHRGSQFCRCPDTPRYRALGNAVSIPVVQWIAERIVQCDQRSSR